MSAQEITPELLLNAYASGYFPMAETRESKELYWFYPEHRGIIPLDAFHVPKSLAKALRKSGFTFTTNQAFSAVIAACAENHESRPESWINEQIIDLYTQLHHMGFAHSIEVWEEEGGAQQARSGGIFTEASRPNEPSALPHVSDSTSRNGGNYKLIGGLYGVSLGGAFFGESMFSRRTNASKAALVHLVGLLTGAGYSLLDTQYTNPHLTQFGVQEIPRKDYLKKLATALEQSPTPCFSAPPHASLKT